jgi:hypothetical protein
MEESISLEYGSRSSGLGIPCTESSLLSSQEPFTGTYLKLEGSSPRNTCKFS